MASHTAPYDDRYDRPGRHMPAWRLLRILWQIVRIPALAVLLVLEPFVSLVLTAAGFVGIVVAVILEFSGDLPRFPFGEMMAVSIGALLLLMAYHALIGIFAR